MVKERKKSTISGGAGQKMAAKTEKPWVPRIKAAMGGMSQTDFAKMLNTTQSMLSLWLAGQEPSPEICVRLGNLAPFPESEWFYKRAGIDPSKMLFIAESRLREMGKPALPGEIIELPLLSMDEAASGREAKLESGQVFRFFADRVFNRASTVALRVDRGAEGVVFAAGDVVVVDRSSSDLQSLWNKVVLVHLDPSVSPPSFGVREWRTGPYMGVLTFSELPWDRYLWGAALGPLGSFKHEPVVIGYRHSQARKQFFQDHVEWKIRGQAAGDPEPREEGLYERESEAARENIKPTPGCTVIGRMVAWFSAATGEAKR